MNATLEVALAFATGYLVGSVPLGLLVVWTVAGIDIRRYGTGNAGAANIRRNVGLFPATAVALGIFLQGLLPALILYERRADIHEASLHLGCSLICLNYPSS